MKVLLINGSPNEKGCTYTALCEVAGQIVKAGINTEIFHVGAQPIRGCTACGHCKKTKSGRCVFNNDSVNQALALMKGSDAVIIGSPVHYAAASGFVTSFLDRCFYAGSSVFAHKPGAAVVSCRRGGATAAFDQLNKYFTITNMPVVSSQYWNMVHGGNPDQVKLDAEGLQTMRTLGNNMVWLLRCIEAGHAAGIAPPVLEDPQRTNFIR